MAAIVFFFREELAAQRVFRAQLEAIGDLGGEADPAAIREQSGEVIDARGAHGPAIVGAGRAPVNSERGSFRRATPRGLGYPLRP